MSPIWLAHGVDRRSREFVVIQQPSGAGRRADVNIVDKAILDHLFAGDNAVMRDDHVVGSNELFGLKNDDGVELAGIPATHNVARVLGDERIEVRS
eukprot:9073496-Heterocapsa_arctica.AAC.1